MVGYNTFFPHSPRKSINHIHSTISKARSKFNYDTFQHPDLTSEELAVGCKLGLDSWADTFCAGKHCYVEEFIADKSVTASGFCNSLGSLSNLPLANVLYAYDHDDGTTSILECNDAIYLGSKMEDSLANPIQSEENGIKIDLRPKVFYPDERNAQTVTVQDGTRLRILFDGVLPYLPVRRPTSDEIEICKRIEFTSRYEWDPFKERSSFSAIKGIDVDNNQLYIDHNLLDADPISSNIMSLLLVDILERNVNMDNFDSSQDDDEVLCSFSNMSSTSTDAITPEMLCSQLHIGLETAKRTLLATTHKYIRTTGLLARRYRTDKAQLRYKQLMRGYGTFYCDYLKSSVTSLRGYIGGVVYTNKIFYPCATEQGVETAKTLKTFVEFVGLPSALHSDNHGNFRDGAFKKLLQKLGIYASYTEPHSPWQNRAEPAIGEIKSYARRLMRLTQTPIRLWCFCYEYSADVLSLLATGRFELKGRTPYETVMNYTPDISEYISYSWFQWCYYFDEGTKTKQLCRWLGPAHSVGQSFCSYVLTETGEFIARSSVIGIPTVDLTSIELQNQMKRFMEKVESKIGNYRQPEFNPDQPEQIYYSTFNDEKEDDDIISPYEGEVIDAKTTEIDDAYMESLDNYIGVEVVVPGKNAEPVLAKVKRRKRDSMGNPVGKEHTNPILDSRVYDLEFPDGRIEEYAVNIIAENLFAQSDDNGWDSGILKEIVDHRKDENIALPPSQGYYETSSGQRRKVITTKGWEIKVRWLDQSSNWIPMALLKESNPVELAEYAVAVGIAKEPAFNWWVPSTLKRRKRLIHRLKVQRVRKGRMKFGITIPGTVEEALELDRKNGNTLWADAIKKEMDNSRIAFRLLERGESPPRGYKEITCHLIFDLKLDMTRKARYVAGGHLTTVPTYMTYSSVVSRDTVRIGFLVAALNDLNVLAGDIQNAFLSAPTQERIFFYAGEEWKSDKDRVVVVVRALYGLKSSALQFRNFLADTLGNTLGFKASLADPDIWLKPATSESGTKYYSYILVYVDDLLIIDKQPEKFMEQIQGKFKVKPSSIEEPKSYLGADTSKANYPDGSFAWTMGSETYIKKAIKNLKKKLEEDGLGFNKRLSDTKISCPQPFSAVNYRAELDTSTPCNDEQITLFQNIIGILRWVVELGRIDIAYEVSCLSRYLVQPRTGHLLQGFHIFKYLDIHSKNDIAFDPAIHEIEDPEQVELLIGNMKKMYPDAVEDIPTNAPEPRGNPIQINCFVDSDHAGDRKTRRSQTGILLYCNSAPIIWYSKRQNTVESSTFGSEFVALRIATELIISLRYKLRMIGIEIMGPTNVFCDNEAVYKNTAFAESTLKKKHNSICYHKVRESVAAGILVVYKVDTDYNLSDILTKSLPAPKRVKLRERIMFCE